MCTLVFNYLSPSLLWQCLLTGRAVLLSVLSSLLIQGWWYCSGTQRSGKRKHTALECSIIMSMQYKTMYLLQLSYHVLYKITQESCQRNHSVLITSEYLHINLVPTNTLHRVLRQKTCTISQWSIPARIHLKWNLRTFIVHWFTLIQKHLQHILMVHHVTWGFDIHLIFV